MRGDEHPTRVDTALAGIDLAQVVKSLIRIAKSSGSVRVNGYEPIMKVVEQLQEIRKAKFMAGSPDNQILDTDLPR